MRHVIRSRGWLAAVALGAALGAGLGAGCDLSQPPKTYRPTGEAGAGQGVGTAPASADASQGAEAAQGAAQGAAPQPKPLGAEGALAPAERLPVRRDLQALAPERLQGLKPMPLPTSVRVPVILEQPANTPALPEGASAP
jgi:hypothetical protein